MKIKPEKDFPDLHLCVTGSHGHELFRIAPNHGRIYLPEQLVFYAKDYTKQQQIDNQQEMKIAKEFGLSVEEYRAQQELIDQANRARDMEHRTRIDLAFEDEEPTHTYSNSPGTVQKSSYFPTPSERAPYYSLPSSPTSSSGSPTQDPSQFAIGSMVHIPTQRGEGLCGLVMWIGTLPEIDGVIAGVELVSYISLIH